MSSLKNFSMIENIDRKNERDKSLNPFGPACDFLKAIWHSKQARQPSMQIPSKPMHIKANAIKTNILKSDILKANVLKANALQRHAIKENIHNYQS